MIPPLKIGVDGGGTKTELILVDARGTIVASHVAPGGNPSQVGPDRARALLHEALAALLAKAGISHGSTAIAATHLYMAGSPQFWAECGAALSGFGRIVTQPDSAPVLELATGGSPGLVLHAGTGSFVTARGRDGVAYYAGGLGWKLGDAGSGFDLGRRAIAVALLELQGWPSAASGKISPLADALRRHTGFDDYATNSRFFYNDPDANAAIAAFAPRVLELAEQDCGPAQQVVADSVTDLARLADNVVQKLFATPASPVPCGISGRILNAAPAAFALRSLATKLRWPVTLNFSLPAPIEGVRRLLLAEQP